MNVGWLDVLFVITIATIILASMRIAYEQGVDAGWMEAGRWADAWMDQNLEDVE